MTYRTDKPLESRLIGPKLVTEEKRPFGAALFFQRGRLVHQWLLSLFGNGSAQAFQTPLAERRTLLMVVDALCLLLALWATQAWALSGLGSAQNPAVSLTLWGPACLLCWWLLAFMTDLYDVPSSWALQSNIVRVVQSVGLGLGLCLFIAFLNVGLPLRFVLTFLALFALIVMVWRTIYVRQSPQLFSVHPVLVVGCQPCGESVTQLFKAAERLNYHLVGFVNDESESLHPQLPRLGQLDDLPRLVDSLGIREIVVATHQQPSAAMVNMLIKYQGQGVRISWLADFYETFQRSIPIQELEPLWALHAIHGQPIFSRLQLVAKRTLDLLLALLALPALLMLLPIIGLCIRLDSPGPIFYKQIRVGRGNRTFAIYKFRTMRMDAEAIGAPQWAVKNDPRITRVGAFLRKTRFDELPQILNILRGDMSFVGPRPERPEFVAQLERSIPLYGTRLLVKPGLTGWAQIHYGYGNSQEDALRKLQFDFYYVRHWSFWRDIYILFKTIAVVIQCKGM